jgi:DNA-directed RNA polymerase subunit RPC12/RpoP
MQIRLKKIKNRVVLMSYRCAKCGTEVTNVSEGLVRCPSCGHRILYKTRDPIAKEVKTD